MHNTARLDVAQCTDEPRTSRGMAGLGVSVLQGPNFLVAPSFGAQKGRLASRDIPTKLGLCKTWQNYLPIFNTPLYANLKNRSRGRPGCPSEARALRE